MPDETSSAPFFLLGPTAVGKSARRGPRPRAWEEIRLVAAQRQGSVETKYGATFGSVQETGNRWGHVAKEAGRGLHSPIHPVCDGAEWIALQIREIFGADARDLTDFYHVSEYLAAAAPGCRRRRTRIMAAHATKTAQAGSQRASHRGAWRAPRSARSGR